MGDFDVRGEAGKLKVVLLIRGCVCRGRPVDTSAALLAEGGGGIRRCYCLLGVSDAENVVLVYLLISFFKLPVFESANNC